jgi:hypothetical protein
MKQTLEDPVGSASWITKTLLNSGKLLSTNITEKQANIRPLSV